MKAHRLGTKTLTLDRSFHDLFDSYGEIFMYVSIVQNETIKAKTVVILFQKERTEMFGNSTLGLHSVCLLYTSRCV